MTLIEPDAVKVSRVLHAGYLFESAQTKILFDPIFENPFSRNCYAFPAVAFDTEKIKREKFTAVFISHFHDDHCSFESLDLLDRLTPIYMFCIFEKMFELIKELGFKNVFSLKLAEPVPIGPFEIIPHKALDEDVDCIFQIKVNGLNILNVVDSWIGDNTLQTLVNGAPWDLIMWPFQTMREIEVIAPRWATPSEGRLPPEWISQIKDLNPKYIIPSSCQFVQEDWSWYNHAFFPITYKSFQEQMQEIVPQTKVIRLDPSVAMTLKKGAVTKSDPIPWIVAKGPKNVDYDYQKDLIPPPTSEIAKNFKALSEEETKFVLNYCQVDLLEKFNSLEPALDPYFEQNQKWQLSVYDHEGKVTSFYYSLHLNKIILLNEQPQEITWLTEVPLAKIYAVLKRGESLTSMYLRINDRSFGEVIDAKIKDVDIVDDPLIRCLFNEEFATYQSAQLEQIRARSR